jgi:hypothetical protein
MPPRWDGDNRGHGVGNAAQLLPGIGELTAAFWQPAWVAEQPEIHLRPHVEAWCRRDQRLALTDAYTDDRSAYIIDLEWRRAPPSVGQARSAVFSLIGCFAESATYVRQRRVATAADGSGLRLQFEVGTGELAPDTRFVPHGHVVIINVMGLF